MQSGALITDDDPTMEKPRKIIYVITKSQWGGAQRYVHDLATNLRGNLDIKVVSGGSGLLGEALRRSSIPTTTILGLERDIRPGREISVLMSLIRIFIRERPDIVHLNSSKVGALGAIAARLASLVIGYWPLVIFTVHGWAFREDRPAWQRGLIRIASWLASLFQDRFILISTADYRSAQRFIPERKLVLIPHGLGPVQFLARPQARAFFNGKTGGGIRPDTTLIGAIAELTANKGLGYLIEAIGQARRLAPGAGLQAVIIGEGEDRRRLGRQIKDLGLSGAVHLLGFTPQASRYLQGLDIFALASVKEGLPYAVMEAMASGLPIVAARVGGLPDLIEDAVSGLLVPPQHPEAMAKAMAEIASRPAWGASLGKRARERVAQSFSMSAMLERTLAIYRSG